MSSQQQQQGSTGHGTVDVPWTEDTKSSVQDNQGISSSSSSSSSNSKTQKSHQQDASEKEHSGFGHTTQHQHSPRSIKRDLNDI